MKATTVLFVAPTPAPIPFKPVRLPHQRRDRSDQRVVESPSGVTNEYHLTGQLKKTSGARTYPVEYTYDHAGRMKTMKTWQDFAGNSGIATTTWNYDTNRGWLTSKQYHDGNGPTYTYFPSGKLKTRTWDRGITTTYAYNNAGSLSSANYSDSTPDITYAFDRLGRQTSVVQGSITTSKTYNNAGSLLTESYAGGPLDGVTVTNSYDSYLRRSRLEAIKPSAFSLTTLYSYDNASRLNTVGDGTNSATYSYLANSLLVEQITFKEDTTPRMTTTKAYDDINRLTSIGHADGATALASYAYAYNSANQRTKVTQADNSYWDYAYDSLGQVISGKKRNSADQLFPGLQYEYAFDDIGNRQQTRTGGNAAGANLRTNDYSVNLLNEYTSRDVAPYVEVLGQAATNATVTVNNQTTDRLGPFYRKEVTFDNSSAPLQIGITNVAVIKNGGTNNQDIVTTETGSRLVAQDPESFTYDSDGNLTSDSLWTNTWNGENRLIVMESRTGVPSAARKKLLFAYDHRGRRIRKEVQAWDQASSSYLPTSTNLFVYDGWNLIAELDANADLIHGFTWGLDLSRSEQGAGGVGGLLLIQTTNSVHLVGHDGNGNVSLLAGGSDSSITAQYEYAPFGQLIRASGIMAMANLIRFSSKYQDDESGYNYYGYRFYNSDTGRWLNRDPIEETDQQNLYLFLRNASIDLVDPLGLCALAKKCVVDTSQAGVEFRGWGPHPKGPGGVGFQIDVTIPFMDSPPADKECCELVQYVKPDVKVNGQRIQNRGRRLAPNDGQWHVDAFPWTPDNDLNRKPSWPPGTYSFRDIPQLNARLVQVTDVGGIPSGLQRGWVLDLKIDFWWVIIDKCDEHTRPVYETDVLSLRAGGRVPNIQASPPRKILKFKAPNFE